LGGPGNRRRIARADNLRAGRNELLDRDEPGFGRTTGDRHLVGRKVQPEARLELFDHQGAQRKDAGPVGIVRLARVERRDGGLDHGLRQIATRRRFGRIGQVRYAHRQRAGERLRLAGHTTTSRSNGNSMPSVFARPASSSKITASSCAPSRRYAISRR